MRAITERSRAKLNRCSSLLRSVRKARGQFLDKMGKRMSEDNDWSADIAKLSMPVLLVFADYDSISQNHVAEFFELLGGGVISSPCRRCRRSSPRS